jgi:eukaryotic-like serine/threonine-protein kinase
MGVHPDIKARSLARVGTTVGGKWHLDDLLGVGGMAAVYGATHRNKKRAAVKMLHRELSTDETLRRRFLREGYVANSVAHRGSVRVDDDDVADDGSVYLVMELLEGETLDARWRRFGRRLPVDEVLWVVDQLLATLAAAHAAGVLHRDVKPDNVFLTVDGVVKVLDFGIARLREPGEAEGTTQTGDVMGTPSYMAPEQAAGRTDDVDQRTDLWAVGALMFTLITGRLVHESSSLTDALIKAVTVPAPSLASLAEDAPASVAALVDRALQVVQADRFDSAATMRTAVAAAYEESFGKPLKSGVPVLGEPVIPSRRAPSAATRIERVDRAPNEGSLHTAGGMTAPPSVPLQRPSLALVLGGVGLVAVAVVAALFLSRTDVEMRAAPEPPATAEPAASAPVPPPADTGVATAAPSTLASDAPATPTAVARPAAPPRLTTTAAPPPPPITTASSDPYAKRGR